VRTLAHNLTQDRHRPDRLSTLWRRMVEGSERSQPATPSPKADDGRALAWVGAGIRATSRTAAWQAGGLPVYRQEC
jgi:hypothetical protein